MIVRNEEKELARCLDSLVDLMDEIIIVDTGSTDRTKEIASHYTKHVLDFFWCNDFAAARNFAASQATMEYMYTADADEVLDAENQKKFAELKQVMLPEIEIVQMQYVNQLNEKNTLYNFEKEYRPKLYRRIRDFVWIDPIHETLRTEPVVFDSEVEILHYPQTIHSGRDFQELHRIFERGIRLSKRLHHMYAMELFLSGQNQDFIEAKDVFLATMEQEDRTDDEVREAICVLVKCYHIQKDIPHMMSFALKDAMQPTSETCCELGIFYEEQNDLTEAMLWYQNAAMETESILDLRTLNQIPGKRMEACREKLDL